MNNVNVIVYFNIIPSFLVFVFSYLLFLKLRRYGKKKSDNPLSWFCIFFGLTYLFVFFLDVNYVLESPILPHYILVISQSFAGISGYFLLVYVSTLYFFKRKVIADFKFLVFFPLFTIFIIFNYLFAWKDPISTPYGIEYLPSVPVSLVFSVVASLIVVFLTLTVVKELQKKRDHQIFSMNKIVVIMHLIVLLLLTGVDQFAVFYGALLAMLRIFIMIVVMSMYILEERALDGAHKKYA